MAVNEKVLLVDDEPNVLRCYERQLRKSFVLETCGDAETALKMVRDRGPYAVVVSDLRMPGMDGIEFLFRLQEEAPRTVRILLSGNADEESIRDAHDLCRIHCFLAKPCLSEELSRVLAEAIERYRRESGAWEEEPRVAG